MYKAPPNKMLGPDEQHETYCMGRVGEKKRRKDKMRMIRGFKSMGDVGVG